MLGDDICLCIAGIYHIIFLIAFFAVGIFLSQLDQAFYFYKNFIVSALTMGYAQKVVLISVIIKVQVYCIIPHFTCLFLYNCTCNKKIFSIV